MKLRIVICVFMHMCAIVQDAAQQPCPVVSSINDFVLTDVDPGACCYAAASSGCNSDNDCDKNIDALASCRVALHSTTQDR